ncbi:MAG: GRAM domain-containing protein [Candidatus Gracilibacteria bacterium]
MAKSLLELRSNEMLKKNEKGIYLRGIMAQMGDIYLTNQRLIFIKNPINTFGLIGLLFNKQKVLFDLELTQIIKVEKSTFGLNKKVILVGLTDGRELKFSVSSTSDEWVALLKK